MRGWRVVRDVTMSVAGFAVLFHQVMVTDRPALWALLLGFALVGLPSSLIAERALTGRKG